MKNNSKHIVAVIIILVTTLCLYYPVVNFGYVWDDKVLILDDIRLQQGALTWEAISRPVLKDTTYFRPLVFLTYFIELKLFGLNPKIPHITNILIFFTNIILAYAISFVILKKKNIENLSWVACFFYAIHPTLVESNAWIAGRFDLLATTFIFLSLIIFIKNKNKILSNTLIPVTFFLGLLSKEMAIIIPGMMFLCHMVLNTDISIKENIKTFFNENFVLIIFMAVIFAAYLLLRVDAVGDIYHFKAASESNIKSNLLLPISTLTFYLHQVIIPFFEINPQHNLVRELEKSYQNIYIYSAIALFMLSLGYAAYKNKIIGWLGIASIFSLFPVLQIIPMTIGNNIGHERFLAAPLLFFILFFMFSFNEIYAKFSNKLIAKLTMAMIFFGFSLGLFFTSKSVLPMWSSNYTLWGWMYQVTPESSYVETAYLMSLLDENKIQELEKEFNKIVLKNGGVEKLSTIQSIIYSSYLLKTENSNASRVIKNAINAIESRKNTNNNEILTTEASIDFLYPLYIDYALAQVILDGDLNAGLKSSLESENHVGLHKNYLGLWHRTAYYYLLGEKEKSKNTYESVKNIPIYDGYFLENIFLDVIYKYCIRHESTESEFCKQKALSAIAELKNNTPYP